jgi:hypothetical protein
MEDDCIDVNIDICEEYEGTNDGRDLQLDINNFCIYMGGFGDPPTLEQQRYLVCILYKSMMRNIIQIYIFLIIIYSIRIFF